jgi:hypothetical protein
MSWREAPKLISDLWSLKETPWRHAQRRILRRAEA